MYSPIEVAMRSPSVLLILTTLILLHSCRESAQLSNSERSEIRNHIQQFFDAHSRAISSEGLVASIRFLDNSPDFRWTYRGLSTSYGTLVAGIHQDQRRWRSVNLQWDSLEIQPLTSEQATFTAHYRQFMTDTAGRESVLIGVVNGALIRRSDGWKFHHAETSPKERP